MRILHISDTHGSFVPLYGSFDIVVHSGDFFPDPPGNPPYKDQVGLWQLDWLKDNMLFFKEWVQNHPFLFSLGNHDHADPFEMEKLLIDNGIKAICLHDKINSFDNINFYGFPYVPYINGSFAYEREVPEMSVEVESMLKKIKSSYVDILVCHAPPYQILDLSYDQRHLGNSVMSNALLSKKLSPDNNGPTYYLCGHIHHSRGLSMINNMLFSNAAVFQQIIEV